MKPLIIVLILILVYAVLKAVVWPRRGETVLRGKCSAGNIFKQSEEKINIIDKQNSVG